MPAVPDEQLDAFVSRSTIEATSEEYRILPSSFNPEDPSLGAITRRVDWEWRSCTKVLEDGGAKGVMMRLPAFWQLESLLHRAAKRAHAYIFINDLKNMPVGAAAIHLAEVDAVVSSAQDSFEFSKYLEKNNHKFPRTWLIINPIENAVETPEPLRVRAVHVRHEVHAFPGVPLLVQCSRLSSRNPVEFHIADEFSSTQTNENTWELESVAPDLRISRIRMQMNETGQCECKLPCMQLI